MHATLEALKSELVTISSQIKSSVPNNEPLNIVHGNWSFPGITRDELIQEATNLIKLIDEFGEETISSNDAVLNDYIRRLAFLKTHTIPQMWGNAVNAIPAYLITLGGLKKLLKEALNTEDTQFENERIEAAKALKRTLKSLRAVESRVLAVDSRSTDLNSKIEAIEQAHEAADQLPTDLVTLQELRGAINGLLIESNKDQIAINGKLNEINLMISKLDDSERKAIAVLDRCNKAYRATTSEGLASAFADRSKSLALSMWFWVFGLIVALFVGAQIGSKQLNSLSLSITEAATQINHQAGSVWVELILTVLSIGAPVWFAWVATKQIGQRFRLSEDYGYKASISKAYEGYRREAELLDPSFQNRLFCSTLDRLDEIPLRLVETDTHGSPWHELASSKIVRNAMDTVPDFMGKVTELATQVLPESNKGKASSVSKDAASKDA